MGLYDSVSHLLVVLLMTCSFIVVWTLVDNIPRIFTPLLDFHWPNSRIFKYLQVVVCFFFFFF